MNQMTLQNVRAALGDLEEDAEYQALSDSGLDVPFNELRQDVETAGMRCQHWPPNRATAEEVDVWLGRMHDSCVGKLARLRPYVERAQAVLHSA